MATMPAADAIREQLDRVVNSEPFSTGGRHRQLLRYLVERTLANEGDRLKEYVVATEVFARPDTYDPRLDSIVRVEARRLRARLENYYRGPGATDPVIISIPRGGYIPQFSPRQASCDSVRAVRPIETRPGGRRRALWLSTFLIVPPALFLATLHLEWMRPRSVAGSVGVPGIAVLPFESYSTILEDRLLAGRLTDEVTAALAALESVSVASRTSTQHNARDSRRIGELADALGVQFVLEASAVVEDARLRVVVRLVDAAIDRKVWVRVYEVKSAEAAALAPRIAAEAANAALEYRAR
jgi:TolB-like protein